MGTYFLCVSSEGWHTFHKVNKKTSKNHFSRFLNRDKQRYWPWTTPTRTQRQYRHSQTQIKLTQRHRNVFKKGCFLFLYIFKCLWRDLYCGCLYVLCVRVHIDVVRVSVCLSVSKCNKNNFLTFFRSLYGKSVNPSGASCMFLMVINSFPLLLQLFFCKLLTIFSCRSSLNL